MRAIWASGDHAEARTTSYMGALAIFIPLSGWMADRFRPKRIFRAAILVFIAGSPFCAGGG